MRAAVLNQAGTPVEICEDIAIGNPGPGQVRVGVRHCGVCHSDLSIIDGAFPSALPVVLGHEAAGVVEAVGAGVEHLKPGDPVVLTPCPPCGTCYWCVRNEPSLCVNADGIATNTFADGTTGLSRNGEVVYRGVNVAAFADSTIVAATGAIKVDPDVPLDVVCVIGCASQTGVGAVLNTAAVTEGATVLVLGLGGVGLSVVQGARLAGAARIIVSDPVAERRAVAESFGATDVIDPTTDDVMERVRAITTVGVDYAFEAAGRAALVSLAVEATRNGGMAVCVGAPPLEENITLAPAALFTISGKTLRASVLGSCHSLLEIPRQIALWKAGRLDLEALITGRRPFTEINDALQDLRDSKGIRTVLNM